MNTRLTETTQHRGAKRNLHTIRTLLVLGLALLGLFSNLSVRAQLPDASDDYTIHVVEPPEGTIVIWYLFINESGMTVMQYSARSCPVHLPA